MRFVERTSFRFRKGSERRRREGELNAFVLDLRGYARDWRHLEGQRRAADRGAQVSVDRDRLLVDELLREPVVDVRDVRVDLLAGSSRGRRELCGDVFFGRMISPSSPVEEERFADDRIDDALRSRLRRRSGPES